MPGTHFSTKDRILAAAEELFAQHGFAGTSLRQVTSRADVNIAAVNYHFGSKENLVNEVFRRRMDEMTQQRLERLEAAVREHPGELGPVLAAFVEPALAMARDRQGGGGPFVHQGARPRLCREERRPAQVPVRALRPCAARVRQGDRRLPAGTGKEQLYWRLDFLAGALTYAMADFGLIKRPASVPEAVHRERAAQELIRFAAAGLRAPID
jgi:AcrR family transcriptional regulator